MGRPVFRERRRDVDRLPKEYNRSFLVPFDGARVRSGIVVCEMRPCPRGDYIVEVPERAYADLQSRGPVTVGKVKEYLMANRAESKNS